MTQELVLNPELAWKPKINPWISIIPIIFAVFIFALNETISNVVLVDITGSLSVSLSEATWVITSYLVASGIAIPLAGFMSKLLGRKNYFLLCIIVFTIASFLCAISQNMLMMVLSRFVQGLGGGGLLPLGQSMILESFPPEDRAKSMGLFGLAFIFAPIIGPILGGWITENWSWYWVYLINIPLGFLCLYLSNMLIEDPPYARKQKNVKVDYKGIVYLSIWLICLQIVLDKGNDADWFAAPWICWLTFISIVSAILFFRSQITNKDSLINLNVMKDRMFFWGTFVQVILMGVFLASATLLPSMLQNLLGYTSFLSGLPMGSRGFGILFAMSLYLFLSKKISDTQIAGLGLFFLGLGSAFFGIINLEINMSTITFPNFLYGLGIFLALTPLVPLSCCKITNEEMTNATGLQNLLKNVGGAIGTSISTTMVARFAQVHQMMMSGKLNYTNNTFVENINTSTEIFSKSVDTFTANYMAHGQVYAQLLEQSHLWAYIDTFRWFAFATFLLIPMLIFLRKPTGEK